MSSANWLNNINQQAQQRMEDGLNQIRKSLQADRVLVYGFNPDGSGQVLAESVDGRWSRAGSSFDLDYNLTEANCKPYYVVNDISTKGFALCFMEAIQALEAKAYIVVPIKYNDQLLGLLSAYQNANPRNWQESELKVMLNAAAQFRIPLQQTAFIRNSEFQQQQRDKAVKQERALGKMLEQIRNAKEDERIFQIATHEGRKLLQADRLAVYRFDEDWGGRFVAESVGGGWTKLIDTMLVVKDTFLQENQGGRYKYGECFAVDDIYNVGHQACHIALLEQFEARAYAIAPIFIGDMATDKKLWGLLGVYQNSGCRKWQPEEIDLLRQLGLQIGIGIQQNQQFAELEKTVFRQRSVAQMVARMQKALSVENALEIAAQETRKLLDVERTSIYRFNDDWSGENVVEAPFDQEFKTLQDSCFQTVFAQNTYPDLQKNQGGIYQNGESSIVNDVSASGLEERLIEVLERLEIKAYVKMPIFVDQKLWGIINLYQSNTRLWKEDDLEFLGRIVPQISSVIQEKQYLAEIQANNEELARRSQRESSIVQFSSRLMGRFAGLMQKNNNLKKLMEFAIKELRQVLKVDRVAIYRLASDWSGKFIIESVAPNWPKLVGTELAEVKNSQIQDDQGGRYRRRESLQVNDIYQTEDHDFPLSLLEQSQTKAYLLVPIFNGEKLWGLLGVYQNDHPRQWENSEQAILEQVAINLGVTLKVGEYLNKLRSQEEQLSELVEKERKQREGLQQGALRVLQALEPSFRGDLTVRAPLSEDEIGTIADGYNTTIQSMRQLVRQVQVSASRVSDTSNLNSNLVAQLSEKAQMQVEQLKEALTQLELMVSSTEDVASCAKRVEQTVEETNRTVQSGDSLMEKTVDEILEIRSTVSDTAKKIKRLGETFQKITKVVNLIENFATQTNLLALNASIEATRAGEAGKGFSVVADEVRSLAHQSANATTEISRLVDEIRTGTNDVTEAMEIGLAQVVNGTNLVRETQQSLSAIVSATNDIKELVAEISQTSADQTQQFQIVTQVMANVSAISEETSQETTQISDSFKELEDTSHELQGNIRQFKVD